MNDEVGIVHKPGCQRQIEPGQHIHQHAFHVHAQMVQRKAKIRLEFQDGLQEFTGKIFAANFSIANNNKIVGQGKLLAGALQFAHQKIFAGKQQDAGGRCGKTRGAGAAPKIEFCACFEVLPQGAVIFAVKTLVEGQDNGQHGQPVIAVLPMGQKRERLFCIGFPNNEKPFPIPG